MSLHAGVAEAVDVVMLKQRGVIDHGIELTKMRNHPWQQSADGIFILKISIKSLA